MDSSPDLFYARNLKDQEDDGDTKLDLDSILKQLDEKYSQISKECSMIIDKKSVAKGSWDPKQRLVFISNDNKHHLKQYIPSVKNKDSRQKSLYPFEALFLCECRSLILYYEDVLLSIEDAYNLLLKDKRDLKLYTIFSALSRIGYYVEQSNNEINVPSQSSECNQKRLIESPNESDFPSKRIASDTMKTEADPKGNYYLINNIRQLKLTDIRRKNKVDHDLINHFKANIDNNNEEDKLDNSSSSSSYLYCVKKSSRPIAKEMSPLIRPLYDEKNIIKPVIPFGSIKDTEQLFESIQNECPIINIKDDHNNNNNNNLNPNNKKVNLKVDFHVYSSASSTSSKKIFLFSVIVIEQDNEDQEEEDEPFPSIEEMFHLISSKQKNPIYFALLSQSLDFNFYSFETFELKSKYPHLWEKHLKSST